ncbi:hypothetical protein [Aeromonas salmonicida]|uniref:hypothetical protein n=1 Tax=Aeromonas salmonicida TaxID=645 RepID=UPI00138EF773|nr:hypothetical protein [Aeromonas salmonicida]
MKRFTHDADLRGMVVLRSLGFQLVPFKLHRFRKQRPRLSPTSTSRSSRGKKSCLWASIARAMACSSSA